MLKDDFFGFTLDGTTGPCAAKTNRFSGMNDSDVLVEAAFTFIGVGAAFKGALKGGDGSAAAVHTVHTAAGILRVSCGRRGIFAVLCFLWIASEFIISISSGCRHHFILPLVAVFNVFQNIFVFAAVVLAGTHSAAIDTVIVLQSVVAIELQVAGKNLIALPTLPFSDSLVGIQLVAQKVGSKKEKRVSASKHRMHKWKLTFQESRDYSL